ncbi:MAG: ABC transporter permease [Chloroflexi bacterium]|nr:ABC transporter permease [Chloroflexota bacterium]
MQEPSEQAKTKEQKGRLRSLVDAALVPILAILTAIVTGGAIIAWAGGDPFRAYLGLVQGSFGSLQAISETTVWATPYIFAGLAVALAFRGGLFNIGAEGQLAFGAVTAAWVGYALPRFLGLNIPGFIHLLLIILLGMAAGALWGAIPGWLKARTGAHEVINTIMMNYVALNIVSYLLNGPMKDPNPLNVSARTPMILEGARLTPIFEGYRFHWGFIIALLAAVGVWWLLWKTTLGFEIRTCGANPDAARYAGMNVSNLVVLSMALSGMLAGSAGVFEVVALNFRHELGFSVGYGFDAIAIALLGKNHPAGVVLGAILFGAMRNGATRMQFLTQIPVDVISIIQALILLFVAADAIVRYIYRIRAPQDRVVLTRGWGG